MTKSLNHLHIVAFDIPWPANYGGVIDIFYKLKAFHEAGIEVTLHCYQYRREQQDELNNYAKKVFYYPRRTLKNPFYSKLPYIVNSRNTTELLDNLLEDKSPILFEGLHCCYYLNHPELKHRYKIVRTHNVEHDYYSRLEEVESNFFKKYFFRIESERLREFEKQLKHANLIAAISPADFEHFKKKYKHAYYLPAFHPNNKVSGLVGKGEYVFYHGNLSVGENDQAARFLVNKVFDELEVPLIIAGSNPSKELQKSLEGKKHIQLLTSLNTDEMLGYIQQAQINILPTFQSTGIKLKLINSLFIGRHCIANDMMVKNTGLEKFCFVANTPEQFREAIKELFAKPYSEEEAEKRKLFLESSFSPKQNMIEFINTVSEKIATSI